MLSNIAGSCHVSGKTPDSAAELPTNVIYHMLSISLDGTCSHGMFTSDLMRAESLKTLTATSSLPCSLALNTCESKRSIQGQESGTLCHKEWHVTPK